PRAGVCYHSIHADHREAQREPTENGEERRAGPDNPELRIAIHVFFKSPQLEHRQQRIDALDSAAEGVGRDGFAPQRSEFHEKESVALKAARKWQVKRTDRLPFE